MTNFEKIRQLSEEEMANYIFELEMGIREMPYCQGNDKCSYLMDTGRDVPKSMCTECVKRWLQQQATEKG